ncbi:MAG: TlpA family protein disulfide reductase [Actinomycetota bacterium]
MIDAGQQAPLVDGVEFGRPTLLWFYKVTCSVSQMAAPKAQALADAYPDSVVGVGEDPPDALEAFSEQYGMPGLRSVPDLAPFPASDAYDIESVPTMFLVDAGGKIDDVVQSWDREGYNRVSARLAELTGSDYVEISNESDGFPPFKPG